MKLYMYGIAGKTHRWIEDFLGNRTQEVIVNGSRSEHGKAISDVPQGTVLGPLLFLIYINDIESQITRSIHLFADDSVPYRPKYSESDSISIQEDIFKLQKWANTWQMTFNNNDNNKHIGRLVRMSVSGYRGKLFEPRQQYVVSLSKTLYQHCFSRLSCEMRTRWGQPREGCSVL